MINTVQYAYNITPDHLYAYIANLLYSENDAYRIPNEATTYTYIYRFK